MKPRLVSFKLCPFVQRSVIVLREKGIDFDISYIDLHEPPEWFQTLSPMGKVPVLQVGETVLFESAVIMEYLDETSPPSLHPAAPLQKALNRAWTEFSSGLFMNQYRLTMAPHDDDFEQLYQQLRSDLMRVEGQLRGPYFNGDEFRLVDAAFAPFFMRNRLLEQWSSLGLLEGLPKLSAWQERLLERPSVAGSVVADFPELLRAHISSGEGYAARRFSA